MTWSNEGKQRKWEKIKLDSSSALWHVTDYVVKSVFVACVEAIITYVREHIVQVFTLNK